MREEKEKKRKEEKMLQTKRRKETILIHINMYIIQSSLRYVLFHRFDTNDAHAIIRKMSRKDYYAFYGMHTHTHTRTHALVLARAYEHTTRT